ncbi:MAG TPA: Lsr2 family protein [Terrabacter sp.]|nr:Lsr2 family protein [Terrabacter sp.]
MAQKVHIVLVDDLDGSEATESVSFGLDGTSYEIDLNDANAARLRDALAEFVGHGRKVGSASRRGRRPSGSAAAAGGPSAREIRDWARSNGYDVPDRGRVSAEVREAFDAAH